MSTKADHLHRAPKAILAAGLLVLSAAAFLVGRSAHRDPTARITCAPSKMRLYVFLALKPAIPVYCGASTTPEMRIAAGLATLDIRGLGYDRNGDILVAEPDQRPDTGGNEPAKLREIDRYGRWHKRELKGVGVENIGPAAGNRAAGLLYVIVRRYSLDVPLNATHWSSKIDVIASNPLRVLRQLPINAQEDGQPASLRIGPDGNLYFDNGFDIDEMDPQTGKITHIFRGPAFTWTIGDNDRLYVFNEFGGGHEYDLKTFRDLQALRTRWPVDIGNINVAVAKDGTLYVRRANLVEMFPPNKNTPIVLVRHLSGLNASLTIDGRGNLYVFCPFPNWQDTPAQKAHRLPPGIYVFQAKSSKLLRSYVFPTQPDREANGMILIPAGTLTKDALDK